MASKTSTVDVTNDVTNGSEVTDLEKAQAEIARLQAEVAKAAAKSSTPKKPAHPALTVDEAQWVADHARPAVSRCLCGCEETTKGRFAPGHDAVLKTRLHTTAEGDNADAAELANAALVTFGWDKEDSAS